MCVHLVSVSAGGHYRLTESPTAKSMSAQENHTDKQTDRQTDKCMIYRQTARIECNRNEAARAL